MTTPATPQLLSVEQVAEILKLHVRTVRGYVRAGTLKATRIGKQYRITLGDLEAFTGRPVEHLDEREHGGGGQIEVSSVVNVAGVTPALASRLTNLVMAVANVPRPNEPPLGLSTTYDEPRDRLRVLLAGDLASTREILGMIHAVLARNEP